MALAGAESAQEAEAGCGWGHRQILEGGGGQGAGEAAQGSGAHHPGASSNNEET